MQDLPKADVNTRVGGREGRWSDRMYKAQVSRAEAQRGAWIMMMRVACDAWC